MTNPSKIVPTSGLQPVTGKPKAKNDRQYYFFALKIVGDFGATIAVPVVGLVLIGQYLDQRYHHQILFTVLGFVLAALISASIIYRKAKIYGKLYQDLK